jgi:hypothetical protein
VVPHLRRRGDRPGIDHRVAGDAPESGSRLMVLKASPEGSTPPWPS